MAFLHLTFLRFVGAALAACLQQSDCILIDRRTPLECLAPPYVDALPEQCQQLKRGFRDCKRGMVDMRKRFRGNQPVSVSQELEGAGAAGAQKAEGVGGWKKSGQLYGGAPAFEAVKERSGDEVVMDPEKTRGL